MRPNRQRPHQSPGVGHNPTPPKNLIQRSYGLLVFVGVTLGILVSINTLYKELWPNVPRVEQLLSECNIQFRQLANNELQVNRVVKCYRDLVVLYPSNHDAHQHLSNLAIWISDRIEYFIGRSETTTAEYFLNQLRTVDSSHPRLSEFRDRISDIAITRSLEECDLAFTASQDAARQTAEPAACDPRPLRCYGEIMQRDRDNRHATIRIQKEIPNLYAGQLEALLLRGNRVFVSNCRDLIEQATPNDNRLMDFDRRLRLRYPSWRERTTGMEFIHMPGGCFEMGSPLSESGRSDDERLHELCVAPFWIGRFEVTQRQWLAIDHELPAAFEKRTGNHPIKDVSWFEVVRFINKLVARTQQRFRLPTEAEWEFAARGGTESPYHWGEEVGTGNANCLDCNSDRHGMTVPVGSFPENPYHLYDSSGNVREWTCSQWKQEYDNVAENTCVDVSAVPKSIVNRGGGWNDHSQFVRSAARGEATPFTRTDLGFRLVWEAATRRPPSSFRSPRREER